MGLSSVCYKYVLLDLPQGRIPYPLLGLEGEGSGGVGGEEGVGILNGIILVIVFPITCAKKFSQFCVIDVWSESLHHPNFR